MYPPTHRNPMRPRPIEARHLGIITASCLKARWYAKNTPDAQAICGPCCLQTPYNEAYRRNESHGFFDNYTHAKLCHNCGVLLSVARPLITCSECHTEYLRIRNALTLEGVSASHLAGIIYDHQSGIYGGLTGLMIEDTY